MKAGPPPKAAWKKALTLFDEYLGLDEEEVETRFRKLETEDPGAATCLRTLLQNDRQEEGVLDQSVGTLLGDLLTETPEQRDATGRLIGNYRLLRRIGRGGMGVVYEAERADGEFEQRVAVKLLRWSADSEDGDARFSRERQILAHLEHPGIARLLDGGKSAEGRPYLVMELVEGRSLDRYCDEQRLSVEDRLRLFVEICRVVHFAHRRLVVHRDLKPSNILVDHRGSVRLLDFGIAKLLTEEKDAGLTRTGQKVMTPEFAAPEQIEGGQITTATDVYSLGVILYELLAGRRQASGATGGQDSVSRRPSQALLKSTGEDTRRTIEEIAAARSLSPRKLQQRLKGALDLIVLKALRRRAEDRYGSADALADDIERHLAGFPIQARNESLLVRSRAFLRRNRGPVAAGLAILLALGLGLVSTLQQARERSRQADVAEAVSDFLVDLFAAGEPDRVRDTNPSALELLNRGAEKLETNSGTSPEIRARLMREIGTIYLHLGEFRRAAHFAGAALLLAQSFFGPESTQAAENESLWGSCLWKLGRYTEAEAALKHALKIQTAQDEQVAVGDSLSALGALYTTLGRYADSEEMDRRALEISRRQFGAQSEEAATDLQNIAVSLWQQGKLEDAEKTAGESLEIRLRRGGEDSSAAAGVFHSLGSILSDEGKYTEAEKCFRRAIVLREKIYGPDYPDLALSFSGLGDLLMRDGRQEEGLVVTEKAVEISRKAYGPKHAELAAQLNNLGSRYYRAGRYKEAGRCFQEALEIWQRTLPPDHPHITTALSNIGMILFAEGDLKQAEAMLRKSLAHEKRRDRPLPGTLCLSMCNLGRILNAEGRRGEALVELRKAQQLAEAKLDPADSIHATIQRYLDRITRQSATELSSSS